ncbi:MAG: hypothetical protein JWL77_4414 [Chthonomonadaceae bacterium]|nr:hypothetical protein [Chthonomonadaceae bacterium]
MAIRKLHPEWTPFSTLHGFVRLILLVDWDPIGVFGYTGAMDEYDSYAAEICTMLCGKVSREQLIAHLDDLEKNTMGGRGERPAQAQVADKLLLVYKTVTDVERP